MSSTGSVVVDQRPKGPLQHEDGPIFTSFSQEIAPYLAEFIGTFLLALTIILNYSAVANRRFAGLANAFMNMILKYSLDHVSGGLVNPSISLSLMLAGRLEFRTAMKLILAQVLGAGLAGYVSVCLGRPTIYLGPKEGFSFSQVALTEILFTSLLCFVFLNTAASPHNQPRDDRNGFWGLSVGFVFMAASYCGNSVAPTLLNSAVAVGIEGVLFNQHGHFAMDAVGYFFYDITGAFVGTWLYRLVRPQEFDPTALRSMSPLADNGMAQKAATRVMGECIGTFYLVLTQLMSRSTGSGSYEPWSVMAVLAALVYALKDVSGGHFNPAVTLSVKLSGRGQMDVPMTLWYIFAQVVSGYVATAFSPRFHAHKFDVRPERTSYAVMAVTESVFTCFVCYTVLATGTTMPMVCKTQRNNISGLAYGASHLIANVATHGLAGCVLNPVVALSFTTVNALSRGETCMSFVVWQLVGSIAASVLFFMTHAHLYSCPVELKDSVPEPAANTRGLDARLTSDVSSGQMA